MNHTIINEAPSIDSFPLDSLLGSVGLPFVVGLAVGYFAKKMLCMVLFLGGAVIVLLFVCEYYNIIPSIDEVLKGGGTFITEQGRYAWGFLVTRLALLTSTGVSSVVGFLVGFRLA